MVEESHVHINLSASPHQTESSEILTGWQNSWVMDAEFRQREILVRSTDPPPRRFQKGSFLSKVDRRVSH